MMSAASLKLDVNLERFSSIAVAISFWDLPDIRNEMAKYFVNAEESEYFAEGKWKIIIDQVLRRLELMHLPEKIKTGIHNIIPLIGEKILHWAEYVIKVLKLSSRYLEKMYWTAYGTVDESKIFELFWEHDTNFYSSKDKNNCMETSLHTLACIWIQEKFINSHLNEMKEAIRIFCLPSKTQKSKLNSHSIITMWICFYSTRAKNRGIQLYNEIKSQRSVPANAKLLLISASSGFDKAVRYFAKKLKNNQQKYLVQAAERVLGNWKYSNAVMKEKNAEMILFLVNKMPTAGKFSFISENFRTLFDIFLNIWPYQELAVELLLYIHENLIDINHGNLLELVLDYLIRDCNDQNPVSKKMHQKFLQKLLEVGVTPKDVKQSKLKYKKYILSKLFELSDFSSIGIILSDPELVDCKEELISAGDDHFRPLVKKGEFERLNEFMQAVCLSEVEKKKFKNKFNFLKEFVKEEEFNLAKSLLKWLSDSEEESIALKREIDSVAICFSYFKGNKFNLNVIDNLLNWQFDWDEEEIKKVKITLRTEELLSHEFCKIWGAHCYISLGVAKNKCSEFLKWFFDPEEVDTFKKEKLIVDEDFVKIFCSHLHFAKNLGTINELFKFCSLSDDKIKEIKQKINNDINLWIELYGINENNFRMADALLDWVSGSKTMKRKIIKKYLKSSKGAELCIKVRDSCRSNLLDPLIILLNLWVKRFGDTHFLRQEIERESRYDYLTSEMKALLDVLGKKGYVSPDDIKMHCNFSVRRPASYFSESEESVNDYFYCDSDSDSYYGYDDSDF